MPQELRKFRSDAGRMAASFIPAAAFTLCLFVVMDRLVSVGEVQLGERTIRSLTTIVPLEETVVEIRVREPIEPIREVAPPPDMNPIRNPQTDGIVLEVPVLDSPRTEIVPAALGEITGPISVIEREVAVPVRAPIVDYPRAALSRGITGDCEVSFSIDAAGRPFNAVASCTDEIFARSSVRAVERTLFAAPVRNGVSVGQDNLVYPIQYRLED